MTSRAVDLAARLSITTATVCWICSFPITSSLISKAAEAPGQNPNCRWKGIPVECGPRGLPTGVNSLLSQQWRRKVHRCNPGGRHLDGPSHTTALTVVAADFDEDGWPDIYVACDSTPSLLFMNNHDGTFREEGCCGAPL